MQFRSSHMALLDICRALNIDPARQNVEKIVLEFPADGLVRVYVKGFVDEAALPQVARVLEVLRVKDVRVADDCTVIHESS